MLTESKTCRIAYKVISLLFVIAAVVCLICDLAINKSLTWSGYPLLSMLFALMVASPLLLLKKYRIPSALAALSVTVMPFLYFLERLTPAKDWFSALGVPIAITGIIAMWITYFFVRFVRINRWYICSALLFIYGVIASSVINYFVSVFAGDNFLSLSNIVSFLSCVAVTVLLAFMGHHKNTNKESEKPARTELIDLRQ